MPRRGGRNGPDGTGERKTGRDWFSDVLFARDPESEKGAPFRKSGEGEELQKHYFISKALQLFSGKKLGRKKFAPDGTPVWDSIGNNAAAHSLHNMLFLLGETMEEAARPVSCRGQLYRANGIETFDGLLAEFQIGRQGEQIPFAYYGAHFIEEALNPAFEIETEEGTVFYSMDEDMVRYLDKNGKEHMFGIAKDHKSKLLKMAEAIALRKEGKRRSAFVRQGVRWDMPQR